jgi:hypothetical protein
VVKRRRRLEVAAACILTAGVGFPSASAEPQPLTTSEKATFNFAFAGRLGSGVYSISDRTVQIYRVPFGYTVHSEEEHRVGLRVTLQTTFGFYDFQTSDIPETGLPDDVDTFGVQPGLELRFLPASHWLLRPYVEAGYSDDRSGDASAWLYTAGVRSLLMHDFEASRTRLSFGNDLFLARADPGGGFPEDDYAMLQTSLEVRSPLGPTVRGEPVDAGLYLVQDLSFDAPHFPLEGGQEGSAVQYEGGVTVGTEPQAKWWKVPLPRLGLGYRFNGDLSAWRFVIGIPATSLGR